MRYDPDVLAALEPGQYVCEKQTPFPRRELSLGTKAFLALLRVYVLVAIAIVAYAFIHALATTPS